MGIANSTVCHNWAHNKDSKGSNLRGDSARLISYSTDIGYNTGRGLVFLSTSTMTPSTGRHLSYAARACAHLDLVTTPIFAYGYRITTFDEKRAFNLACYAVSDQLEGLSKAKMGRYLACNITQARNHAEALTALAEKYGFDVPAFFAIDPARIEAAAIYAAQYDAHEQVRARARQSAATKRAQRRREQDLNIFEAWRSGAAGIHQCPASFCYDEAGGYYLAVHGDTVVTSGDAECPVDHARRGIEFWWSRKADFGAFKPWQKNGHRVQLGVFQLDRIDADGVAYAGCHKFNVPELERLASILL